MLPECLRRQWSDGAMPGMYAGWDTVVQPIFSRTSRDNFVVSSCAVSRRRRGGRLRVVSVVFHLKRQPVLKLFCVDVNIDGASVVQWLLVDHVLWIPKKRRRESSVPFSFLFKLLSIRWRCVLKSCQPQMRRWSHRPRPLNWWQIFARKGKWLVREADSFHSKFAHRSRDLDQSPGSF